DGYLSKPIDENKLAQTLSKFAGDKKIVDKEVDEEDEAAEGGDTNGSAAGPVIDIDAVLRRVSGNKDILKMLAGQFLDLSRQQLDQIKTAVDKDDAKALEIAAHTFKGSLLNFEARIAAESAKKLEYMGREGSTEGASEIFDELSKSYSDLRVELEKLAT
ncbi:MAG: Hpt domain-containing protein, partial [Candidatus Eremiobacteraeota bacterium]|nr:Hpt domain-containing protein [Candidatus Eremiobacteraeota bacterium]